jgi:hypothetical protein
MPLTPEQLADIVGTTGAHFRVTTDSGSFSSPSIPGATAKLIDPQTIEIDKLPIGWSDLTFGIVFGPGDAAGNIGIGTVFSGTVIVHPGRTLDKFEPAPAIYLFGK